MASIYKPELRTGEQVADDLYYALHMNDTVRARVSEKSIKKLRRQVSGKLRGVTIRRIIDACADRGILMGELEIGGFGVILMSALNGAKPMPIDLEALQQYKEQHPNLGEEVNEDDDE